MKLALCIFGITVFALTGCSEHTKADYDIALKNGISSLEVAKEFNSLFPETNNFIIYYTGEYGTPKWNSVIGLYGRYVLTVQFDLSFDTARHTPLRISEPRFILVEVDRIDRLPDGRLSISYSKNQISFGMEEWNKIIAKRGDLSAIDYSINESSPHKDFEEVWQ